MSAPKRTPAPALTTIEGKIVLVRGHKVMLDADLAALYAVHTRRLNEQVRRNSHRFPADFMFQLTDREYAVLISQIATSKAGRGGRRKLPLAFTEHGAIMAATVLNSPRAIEVSVYVVRAFVRLREMISANKELAKKFEELERRLDTHDQAISEIMHALRQLMAGETKKRPIGFVVPKEKKRGG